MLRDHRLVGFQLLLGALATVSAAISASAQPAPPVRVIAEWEPAIGTLISWPLGIPQELVVELADDDMLFVLVRSQQHEDDATNTFNSWGIDLDQVEFIQTNVETHWPRDWGPHQIFDGNGQWSIVDPIFRGYPWVDETCGEPIASPGGHVGDDAVNIDFAAHFGAPLHGLPAFLTGGNFLVDGHETAFSTCAMADENLQLWTESEFLLLAEQYLGVTDYHIVNNTENHGIQHIDCWLKPLDEETLLVKRPPTWHEEYDRIEENLQILQSAVNCYGRPYRIVRIDCPPYGGNNIAAYTNSLILNTKVLVPLFNIPGDAQALQTFAEALPGYEITGFPWGSWYYYDALHCRTRAVFDRYMLRITHRRLDEEVPLAPEHTITAFIDDRSEAGLIADELRVYWRTPGAPDWNWELLTPNGEPDTYEATIPGQTPGATVDYYVAAADYSGRAETLPRSAPAGIFSFTVIDTGLAIEVDDPPILISPGVPTAFNVTIDPGSETLVPDTALLHYRYDGGEFLSDPLVPLGGDQYRATLPPAECDGTPEFYVCAEGSESGLKTAPSDAPASVFAAEVGQLITVTVLGESFEAGLPTGWSTSGLWHVTEACEVNPPPNGSYWAYYGQDVSCDYDTGDHNSGELTTASITLPDLPPDGEVVLSYFSNLETEDEDGYDVTGLYVDGILMDTPAESAAWQERTNDLSAFAGQSVVLVWSFDSIDDYYNDFHGWQLDGVTITASELVCRVPGDLDGDGDVDLEDFEAFADCMLGPDIPCPAGCEATDLTGDGDADLTDFTLFQAAFAGP